MNGSLKKESKRSIKNDLGVSWDFINAWTQSPDQDCTVDLRGWRKGRPRIHPEGFHSRIVNIRKELEANPDSGYSGHFAIQRTYQERYPDDPVPAPDYIKDILHDAGLTHPHHEKRRGTARYLCYPETCVLRQGERIAEVDFVGEKFIAGHSYPLHFLGVSYRRPAKLRCYQRTNGETTQEAIKSSRRIFSSLGWPDVTRIDAGTPFSGRVERSDGAGARSVSQYAAFLLTNRIIPVFGAIRSPWNQGSIEGSNSVFGKNFWGRHTFTSVQLVDEKLEKFNERSRWYAGWTEPWPRTKSGTVFAPRICFIRKVEEDARSKEGFVRITSEPISLPPEYIGLFTFSEWDLKKERLRVFLEREREITQIHEIPFLIHPRSRERCTDFIT